MIGRRHGVIKLVLILYFYFNFLEPVLLQFRNHTGNLFTIILYENLCISNIKKLTDISFTGVLQKLMS